MLSRITAYVEKDVDTGMYIAIVPTLPGAHTQASSLDELQKNLKEVVELCMEELDREDILHLPEFVGLQQVEVALAG